MPEKKSATNYFMNIALQLAYNAKGFTSPNPAVGAVIVKNNKIIGCGYHPSPGMPHAEKYAIMNATKNINNSSLYVTLEPCCHYGKTPPCTLAIINAKIKNVFIATPDPNPIVNNIGIQELIKANINVSVGMLSQQAQFLNREYFTFHIKKRPFIRIKFAQTLDGKIATSNNQSKWLSNEKTRAFTHRLRAISDSILLGSKTIIYDNPHLNIRIPSINKKYFYRLILDPYLETPPNANLFNSPEPVIIFASKKNRNCFPSHCELIEVPILNNKFDLNYIMKFLFEKNIQSVLIEGGASTISSFLENNLVDELYGVITPKIMGGTNSLTFSQFIEEKSISQLISIKPTRIIEIGEDIIIHYIINNMLKDTIITS